MATKNRAAFKIHGGKNYLAKWIISNFPENYQDLTYVEPYCGAANVLLAKKQSKEEYVNDIDPGVVVVLRAIRDSHDAFVSQLKKIKYCKETFENALEKNIFHTDIDYAVNEFILRRMSRDGLKKAFAWSDRTRGGKPGDVNAWETILDQLKVISDRTEKTLIFNSLALDVIHGFNEENVFLYVDPTYLPETRVSKQAYEFEMTLDDHIELGDELVKFKGKVMISGYPSTLYSNLFKEGWRCIKKQIANHSSQQKVKPIKTEAIWVNY